MDEKEKLRSTAEAMIRAEGDTALHLSEGELLGYREGTLEDFERERLEKHLFNCRTCLDILLAVSHLLEPDDQVSEAVLKSGWQSFRQRTGLTEPVPRNGRAASGETGPVRISEWLSRNRSAVLAAAASLAAGLAFMALVRPLDRLERVQVNTSIYEIVPEGSTVKSPLVPDANAVKLPSDGQPLIFILLDPFLDEPSSSQSYEIEVQDADGRQIWSGRQLKPDSLRNFSLTLKSRFFSPGKYHLIVRDSENPSLTGRYEVTLQ